MGKSLLMRAILNALEFALIRVQKYDPDTSKKIVALAGYVVKNQEELGRFKKDFEAIKKAWKRKNKFAWAASSDKNQQIKGNIVGVLECQMKKPNLAHMAMSSKMSLLSSLDVFAKCEVSREKMKGFIEKWKQVSSRKEKWSDENSSEFNNIISGIRRDIETYIDGNPKAEGIEEAKVLQSKLCYIEAGVYAVSEIEWTGSGYTAGPRKEPSRVNLIEEGFYEFSQPHGKNEAKEDKRLRRMQHDILIQELFDREENLFKQLDLKARAKVKFGVADTIQKQEKIGEIKAKDGEMIEVGLAAAVQKLNDLRGGGLSKQGKHTVQGKEKGEDAIGNVENIQASVPKKKEGRMKLSMQSKHLSGGWMQAFRGYISNAIKEMIKAISKIAMQSRIDEYGKKLSVKPEEKAVFLNDRASIKGGIRMVQRGFDRVLEHTEKHKDVKGKERRDKRSMVKLKLIEYLKQEKEILKRGENKISLELLEECIDMNEVAQEALKNLEKTSKYHRLNKAIERVGQRSMMKKTQIEKSLKEVGRELSAQYKKAVVASLCEEVKFEASIEEKGGHVSQFAADLEKRLSEVDDCVRLRMIHCDLKYKPLNEEKIMGRLDEMLGASEERSHKKGLSKGRK